MDRAGATKSATTEPAPNPDTTPATTAPVLPAKPGSPEILAGTVPPAVSEAAATVSSAQSEETKAPSDSDDEAESCDTDSSDAQAAPPLPLLMAPTPPLSQPAAAPLRSGPAASAPQGDGSSTPEAKAIADGQGQAQGSAATPLALRVQARSGRAEASEGGDRAKAAEGEFAAALAPRADASAILDPPPQSLAQPAAATPAATAPASTGAPAPAPVPLGAVPMTIGLRSLAGSNQFEIRLDPKDLGRIDVNLAIDKDTGTVRATLVVDRPETLALLQRDAGNLQQALSQAGLDAPDGSISLSLRGDGAGRDASNGSGPEDQRSGARGGERRDASADPPTSPSPVPLRLYGGLRGLDIRI